MRSWNVLTPALLLAGVTLFAACSSGPQDTGDAAPAVVSDVQPTWASKENFVGRVERSASFTVQIHLQMRDEAGARAELAAVSDPDSATYGRYLSNEDFAAKYAPTAADVAAVQAHLEKSGLRVTHVPSNRAFISASGDAESIERAFATELASYKVGQESRFAPLRAATLPKDVAAHVHAVLGLTTSGHARPAIARHAHVDAATSGATGATCSNGYGQHTTSADPKYGSYQYPFPTAPCGGTPPDLLRRAYGIDDVFRTGVTGKGQTIAIIDSTLLPTLFADAQEYAAKNDPSHPLKASQYSQVWGPGAVEDEEDYWYTEEALDVEASHAFAPDADIVFVSARSDADQDMVGALNMVVADKLANIVSNSWGDYYDEVGTPDSLKTSYEQVAIEAGLKGIGLYFASGDEGDNTYYDGAPSPSFPTILSEVTAVGGTSLGLTATGERIFETAWQTSLASRTNADGTIAPDWSPAPPGQYDSGSGGGTSASIAQPTYQVGVVPSAISAGGTRRVIPDVAMVGDPYAGGILVGRHRDGPYTEFFEGGTSLSTPLFAASMALAQQFARHTFGFANPVLYKAAKLGAFRDIEPSKVLRAMDLAGVSYDGGDLWTFDYSGPGSTLVSTRGYDNLTGLGAPAIGEWFLIALDLAIPRRFSWPLR